MSLENPCTFLLEKEKTWKRIFNTNSELSQNRAEKQIMPTKTINCLFNDVWCYLFIACFDWKIGVFQQTVIRVYYILKGKDTLRNFSFRAFHEIQFQRYFMKHEILSWNTFTLRSNIPCVCFSSIKNSVCREIDIV